MTMVEKVKESKYIKCPFFRAYTENIIYCEGVMPNTTTHIAFESKGKKNCYITQYCACQFTKCRVYRMCDMMYDDMGIKHL